MRICIALLLFGVVVSGHAAERGPWSSVQADAIRGHVEFLANDLLEGRAAASRGYDIAAAYVAAQFRESGLQPDGDDGAYFQSVPLLEATPVLPGSSAQLVRDDGSHTFEYSTHYLPSADFTSASSTLTAPLVFAGFGVDAPELGHDDFEHIDVTGRIAVVFSGAPAKFPHDQRAYYSWTQKKWTTLIEHGAVGLITVDSLVDAERVPWERSVAMSWTPQMRWLDADGKPQNAFPELKLRFRFNHESARTLFEGASLDLDQALAAAEAGTAQGFELQGLMTMSATTGLRRTESANVLAVLPGVDPELKNEYVVLTAHLDHLGRGAAVNGDSIYNGAHDNAVGVGILLEIARTLRATDVKPRRSIVFAAVTAEEKGLLGSDYYANRVQTSDRRVVANINIDMPMIFAPLRDFVALGAEHSSLGALARNAAGAFGYRLSKDAAPEEVSFIRSDQFSFIRQGVPAIAINGGYQARDGKTDIPALMKQFRETHYHQPSDEADLPMDYASVADLARINLRIALDAANAARPQWNRGDFFGDKFQAPSP
jgi:Peptidase family M28